MAKKMIYEIENIYGQATFRQVADNTADTERMIQGLVKAEVQLPRYHSVCNNNAYSWDFCNRGVKEMTKVLPEGKYWVVFDYECFSYGWAAGGNWYAVATYLAPDVVAVS